MGKAMTLDDILAGVQVSESEKTAAAGKLSHEDQAMVEELAMLDKVAAEMDQDELMKVAGAAKLTGEIVGDVVLAKLAAALPTLIYQTLEKIAVGDSEVISGATRESQQDADPRTQTMAEDQLGKSEEPVGARNMAYAERTEGASASGGEHASHQGDPISNTHGNTVGKVANAAMGYGVGDEGGSPEEILQALMAKQQSGERLTPEEERLLQELMQQAGGGEGGMPVQASARQNHAQKVAAIQRMLRERI